MTTTQTPSFLDAMRQLLGSKKFVVYVAGLIALVLSSFGFSEVTEDQVSQLITLLLSITGMTSSYLFAQGKADQGKEAAKIEAESIKQQMYLRTNGPEH